MYNKNRVSGSATLLSDLDLLRLARELSFVRCRAIRINDANLSISSEKKVLTAIYKFVVKANSKCVELPPVADTLIDNFYLVEKNLTAISDILKVQRLPHSIPVSAEGSRNSQLRVYGIASELLAHKEYRFNEEVFYSFIREFQKIAPLGSAELELLPLMLKIVCIEQLTASALTAIQTIAEYESADEVWETLSKYSNSKRKQKEIIRQSVKTLDSAGINHLYSYLCEKDSFELISYLKDELATQSRTIEDENDLHIQRQSDSHRIAANAINSLKFIDTMNWEQAYNALSVVREALSADELYNNMNLTSKKKYAEIVSKIALDLDVTEAAVAMRAVNLAKMNNTHVGRYLLDDTGIDELRKELRPDCKSIYRTNNHKLNRFILIQLAIAAVIVLPLAVFNLLEALFVVIPALTIANAIAVRLLMKGLKPRFIPRLEIGNELEESMRTIVIVPTLIFDKASVEHSVEQVETHYLSNPLEGCFFAVLGDFSDSNLVWREGEVELVKYAEELVEKLNKKYPCEEKLFYFLHRERTKNEPDGIFMGRERKRGAVMDFISYVLNKNESPYALISSPLPEKLKYCVVVDSDTIIPRESLKEMIGAMAHPQNAPVLNEHGVVVSGYGLMFPRMDNTAKSAAKTKFSKVITGFGGVSSYSGLACDFYSDIFREGTFCGKGIFDIEVFAKALEGKIRDNTVLSHDLLEGCFVRAGYLSDVVFYDGEPSTYISWWKRQHRWLRGDWQLLPYLSRNGKDLNGVKYNTYLSRLARWKILDNLRRSLIIPSVMMTLLLSIFIGWRASAYIGIAALLIDQVIDCLSAFVHIPKCGFGKLKDQAYTALRAVLRIIMLPYEAYISLDAIIRTLVRVNFTHRRMLEWQTAAESEKHFKNKNLAYYYRKTWVNTAFGIFYFSMPFCQFCAAIVLGIAWIFAPAVIYLMDLPKKQKELSEANKSMLEELAKQIWAFFDEQGEKEHGFIPPDNVQENPKKPAVRITSPTNIGMGLMATVCAYDLGYIDADTMLSRLEITIVYINRLEKWNGHLFNWYSINTGEKLEPPYISTVDSGNLAACLLVCAQSVLELNDGSLSAERREKKERIAQDLRKIAYDMDFSALFDNSKSLFHIGFDYNNGVLNQSWYDLLASEARLSYFVACAMNKIPVKAWFSLGRLLIKADKVRALISWGGTMFEYLMPVIFTPNVEDTLLDESCKNVVIAQRKYAESLSKKRTIPWGISESGYYAFDQSMYYQYRAFGVPKLGLCPIRERELVIAPYATVLALLVDKEAACDGIRLFDESMRGRYGYFEAIDYTNSRVRPNAEYEIVESYMAHHQGMSLCAITNVLRGNIIQERFSRIPEIRTVLLLNEEELPSNAITLKEFERTAYEDEEECKRRADSKPRYLRRFHKTPQSQLLTNGEYTVFICDNGVGFSKCGDVYLTRFRPDYLRSDSGVAVCIKCDDEIEEVAPALCQQEGDSAFTVFDRHRVEQVKRIGDITCKVETIVSPDCNGELRQITLINHGSEEKTVEVGVFSEVSLASFQEDISHPAFVRVTVDAELADDMLLFHRRGTIKRKPVYMYAQMIGGDSRPRYVTDRLIIPGRNSSHASAMKSPLFMSADVTAPIEPGICARSEVTIKAGESNTLLFVMGLAKSKEQAISDCRELSSTTIEQVRDLAWAKSMSALRFMNLSAGKAELFEKMAAFVLLRIRKKPDDIKVSRLRREELHKFGISNVLPLVLVKISNTTQLRLLKTLLKFHEYMSKMGCNFELAIVGDYENEYSNELRSKIADIVSTSSINDMYSYSVRVIHGYEINDEVFDLLCMCALIVIDPNRSLDRQFEIEPFVDKPQRKYINDGRYVKPLPIQRPKLLFDNGLGGFDEETGDYLIMLSKHENTPLPWSNILVNEGFGTLITESGGGYTWKGNSHENRITPWHCDPVRDPLNEIILLRDDETGEVWTVTHGALQGEGQVLVRHGFGYSSFTSGNSGLEQVLTVAVDDYRPIKLSRLSISNPAERKRHITCFYIVEYDLAADATPRLENNALFMFSAKTHECRYTCAVIDGEHSIELSTDRDAVLNQGWHLESISKHTGKSNMACICVTFSVNAGEKKDLLLMLGEDEYETAKAIIDKSRPSDFDIVLQRVKALWNSKLNQIVVKTPEPEFDLLINRRLLYQVYASRLMARTGYYQSGGAYGFRDQLQDVLALLHSNPMRAKGQILISAAMQFEAGDVLHWWHTPSKGVRTRITDDRLFLPFVTAKYCEVTGDYSIYDEKVPYLKDVPLQEHENDKYFVAEHTSHTDTLYEHCMRAIEATLELGAHKLPLMGGSDWNDGMDCVGRNGGESVFLAFFLQLVIEGIAPIAKQRNDKRIAKFERVKEELREAVEVHAWDGAWYKRAFFGDGTPLGSHTNTEGLIDIIPQVFSVFAGAERAKTAYKSAVSMLMNEENGTIALLTPPYGEIQEGDERVVGYIQAYLPGVRENGGQYTHAAAWSIIAACKLNNQELAMRQFRLINPINHTAQKTSMLKYKGEPYAVAGDVYSFGKNASRAGWTWYTGSAAWLYVAAVESILGIVRYGNTLKIQPNTVWNEYSIEYKYLTSVYKIKVKQFSGSKRVVVDGITAKNGIIELIDDGKVHDVLVEL